MRLCYSNYANKKAKSSQTYVEICILRWILLSITGIYTDGPQLMKVSLEIFQFYDSESNMHSVETAVQTLIFFQASNIHYDPLLWSWAAPELQLPVSYTITMVNAEPFCTQTTTMFFTFSTVSIITWYSTPYYKTGFARWFCLTVG